MIDYLKLLCLQDPYNLFSEAEVMNLWEIKTAEDSTSLVAKGMTGNERAGWPTQCLGLEEPEGPGQQPRTYMSAGRCGYACGNEASESCHRESLSQDSEPSRIFLYKPIMQLIMKTWISVMEVYKNYTNPLSI